MIKLDCSEVKSFRHCKRKWQFESRNSFHLRPVVTPKAFKVGTVFHESLHKLYLGKCIGDVEQYIYDEMEGEEPKDTNILLSMIRGYNREVMPDDRETFKVLDIEHHFVLKPYAILEYFGIKSSEYPEMSRLQEIEIHGSIDMIALNTAENAIYGFEHKTAKNFRSDSYLWMDEQPRLYFVAMMMWVAAYNLNNEMQWEKQYGHLDPSVRPPKPPRARLGGIYINEVRKLVRMFEYKRSTLRYKESDIRNFMISFFLSCAECHKLVNRPDLPRIPQPDYMACSNCQFNTLCKKFMYADVKLEEILEEFKSEYKVRENDHLEDKQEVSVVATE